MVSILFFMGTFKKEEKIILVAKVIIGSFNAFSEV